MAIKKAAARQASKYIYVGKDYGANRIYPSLKAAFEDHKNVVHVYEHVKRAELVVKVKGEE